MVGIRLQVLEPTTLFFVPGHLPSPQATPARDAGVPQEEACPRSSLSTPKNFFRNEVDKVLFNFATEGQQSQFCAAPKQQELDL